MTSLTSEEITDVQRFAIRGAALDLKEQLTSAIAEIEAKRPLSPNIVHRLQSEILHDRVHSSAVTEGNRLSKRETIVVLTTGLIEAGPRRDALEVRNLARAILELERGLNEGVRFDAAFFRHLHKLLLAEIDDNAAGQYRTIDVDITGAKAKPPMHLDVEPLIRAVLTAPALEDKSIHVLQRAAWAHWAIARIHPFKDGNGRIARLVLDYVLLSEHYVPAPLRSEDREGAYYAALEAADLGDGNAFVEMVAKNTLRMADRYVSIIREADAGNDWVARITRVATENVRQSVHRKFLRHQRSSQLLKTEFYELATQLSARLPGIAIRFRDYGSLEFEKFQELESRGTAKRTWLFGLEFHVGDVTLRYRFWFGSHRAQPYDVSASLPSKVVLLVSGEEGENYYRLLDDLDEERVSLREIVPADSVFWRRRHNPVTDLAEWDQDITAGQIARDFFEEVLGRLGLV